MLEWVGNAERTESYVLNCATTVGSEKYSSQESKFLTPKSLMKVPANNGGAISSSLSLQGIWNHVLDFTDICAQQQILRRSHQDPMKDPNMTFCFGENLEAAVSEYKLGGERSSVIPLLLTRDRIA